jgi:hypothetical protein
VQLFYRWKVQYDDMTAPESTAKTVMGEHEIEADCYE